MRLRGDGVHVVVAGSVGPVPREHLAAPRVAFDLPERAASGRVLKAEVEPADAREERADADHAAPQVQPHDPRSLALDHSGTGP